MGGRGGGGGGARERSFPGAPRGCSFPLSRYSFRRAVLWLGKASAQSNRLYHTEQAVKGKKWWRYCFERGADGSILNLESRAERREVPFLSQNLVGARLLTGAPRGARGKGGRATATATATAAPAPAAGSNDRGGGGSLGLFVPQAVIIITKVTPGAPRSTYSLLLSLPLPLLLLLLLLLLLAAGLALLDHSHSLPRRPAWPPCEQRQVLMVIRSNHSARHYSHVHCTTWAATGVGLGGQSRTLVGEPLGQSFALVWPLGGGLAQSDASAYAGLPVAPYESLVHGHHTAATPCGTRGMLEELRGSRRHLVPSSTSGTLQWCDHWTPPPLPSPQALTAWASMEGQSPGRPIRQRHQPPQRGSQ